MFYVRPQLLTSPYHTQKNPLCNSMRHKETTIVKTQKHQAVHKKNKQIHRNRTDSQRVIELLSLLYNVLCASKAFCQSNNQVPSIYTIYTDTLRRRPDTVVLVCHQPPPVKSIITCGHLHMRVPPPPPLSARANTLYVLNYAWRRQDFDHRAEPTSLMSMYNRTTIKQSPAAYNREVSDTKNKRTNKQNHTPISTQRLRGRIRLQMRGNLMCEIGSLRAMVSSIGWMDAGWMAGIAGGLYYGSQRGNHTHTRTHTHQLATHFSVADSARAVLY